MLIGTQQNSTLGENESQTCPGGLGGGLSYSRCYPQKGWGDFNRAVAGSFPGGSGRDRGAETRQRYSDLVCLKSPRAMGAIKYHFSQHLMSSSLLLIFIINLGHARCFFPLSRSAVLTSPDSWTWTCVVAGCTPEQDIKPILNISLRSNLKHAILFLQKNTHPPGEHNTVADKEQKPAV